MERRKITVSLPSDLLRFADDLADQTGASRSAVVAEALDVLRRTETDKRLEEGYRFYADSDRELAEEGLEASREVWPDD
jgi:metal-responsive CopG/Arc/MetJ family transcriptional regulator